MTARIFPINFSQSHNFYASSLNAFLLSLFERYTQLEKQRISEDFDEVCCLRQICHLLLTLEQIVSSDNYMPMPISNLEDYDKIIDVVWYTPDKEREDVTYVLRIEHCAVHSLTGPDSLSYSHSPKCIPCVV